METFDSGVEDAEAEPVEVIVRGREVVHVEQHRRRGSAVPAAHPLPSLEISRPAHHEWAGERLGLCRSADSCGRTRRGDGEHPPLCYAFSDPICLIKESTFGFSHVALFSRCFVLFTFFFLFQSWQAAAQRSV